ncbi:concanavalin A-like lectin/glucanase domain-containing protein [Lasiosphaeris hirsuta]|uniref:Concanavalin A-like lectin/glucanase domain-containing protein n=1 Tax=Lasiosphaeris hirsuta TaxID=260670 RepID=A0AA40A9Y2_9PEZI|nr:concanavalin A-like lectin/glucanase domain-containing protein [Lasiosphaeris hirsuta]
MLFSARVQALALLVQQVAAKYDATVCDQKSYTSSDDLTFNPNAWNPDGKGFQCISVQDSPPTFDATWSWVEEPQTVHSYPHVKLTAPALPAPLSNISALILTAQWSMGPGKTPLPVLSLNESGLADVGATANVAFDIFADRNPAKSEDATTAETEIMIWVGKVGSAQPLGYDPDSNCILNQTVGHVKFVLYHGKNHRETDVFTWLATSSEPSFAAEISPLLQYLWRNGLISPASYIGVVEFGTEAFHSLENVTFSASNFHMDLLIGPAPALVVDLLPDACSFAESAGHRSVYDSCLSRMSIIGTVAAVLYFL